MCQTLVYVQEVYNYTQEGGMSCLHGAYVLENIYIFFSEAAVV